MVSPRLLGRRQARSHLLQLRNKIVTRELIVRAYALLMAAISVSACSLVPREMQDGTRYPFAFSDADVLVVIKPDDLGYKAMTTNANMEVASSPNLMDRIHAATADALKQHCGLKTPRVLWRDRPNVLWTRFVCE